MSCDKRPLGGVKVTPVKLCGKIKNMKRVDSERDERAGR